MPGNITLSDSFNTMAAVRASIERHCTTVAGRAPVNHRMARMDPNNPVVKLCAQGIEAEMKGHRDEARSLFLQAWELRQDDGDACIAAHYVARHQQTPVETLRWNELALTHAMSAPADAVRPFYPSLYLNLGKSYEDLGDSSRARGLYEQGEQCIKDLPDSGYGDIVRQGLHNALQRVRRVGETER